MLKFTNGKFKIMQITDIQEIPKVSPDTIKLLNSALDREKPDLIVLTGDQIKGYGITYKGKKDIEKTISKILEPITSRSIPFAVTFGNHDRQAGLTNEDQLSQIYKKYPTFVDSSERYDAGTYNIQIYSSDNTKAVFGIYLIDSGTDKKGGGYDAVTVEQIYWYRQIRDKMGIPSLVFQHIPPCEIYNLLKKVNRFTPKRIRAYRSHKNEFYILDDSTKGHFLEPPSIPDTNSGEVDAFLEKGDIVGIFVGHDHKNDFVGKYKGLEMGFTPSAGFNEYGNGLNRGVRVIELDENNPSSFSTRIVTYKDLGYNKLQKPLKDFIYRHSPATIDSAIVSIRNAILFVICIVVLILLAKNLYI